MVWPVRTDSSLTIVVVWQRLQPTELKSDWPFSSDAVLMVVAGGASRRMKFAKFTASDDSCAKVPVVEVPLRKWL